MRFFAVHNSAGDIFTLISIPQNDLSMVGMTLEAGQRMTQVEIPGIPDDLTPPDVLERTAEVVKNFQVRVEDEPVRSLVERDAAEPAEY